MRHKEPSMQCDCCEDFIRIAFTLDIYKIKEGIQRLKRFVESL